MASQRDQIIWDNVEKILNEKKWTLVDLAKAMDVTPQAVNSLKSGLRGIGQKSLKKLAAALDVEEIRLLAVSIPEVHDKPIPVISWVHAGLFAECVDAWPVGVSGEGEPVYSRKKTSPYAFALRIEGDSMEPRYMDGDIIVVDPALSCDSGCPCVVWLNGEVSFKIFRETADEIRLCSLNDKYGDIVIRKGGKADFKVIGKVVDMIPKL